MTALFDEGVRQEGDTAVPELDQVLDCKPRTAAICRDDTVSPGLTTADEDDRDSALQARPQRSIAGREGQEDDAGDSVLEHHVDSGGLGRAVPECVAEHRRVATSCGLTLDELRHLGVEGIVQVPDDRSEELRALLSEITGD